MTITKAGWLLVLFGTLTPCVTAQVSLSSAVDLAMRNSPRIKVAQADLDKAKASLAEAHDVYVPAVTTTGGVGSSTGVPLGLPVVFSISAQSLAFNFSQTDYVRAARAGVAAAESALREAGNEAAEDAAVTYISLDSALRRREANAEALAITSRLTQILDDRFSAGLEPHIEVTKTRRTAAQIRLQQIRVEDEIAYLSAHLARLTGVTGPRTETIHDSIPTLTTPAEPGSGPAESDGLKAALSNVIAKQYVARGDARYRWRPQLGFSANYSRISTAFNNYALYYPGFNTDRAGNTTRSFNSLGVGVQISVPLLDLVHQARARNSAADARRAHFDAEVQRIQFLDGRLKLEHAARELAARTELASIDRDLAQDQLDAVELQLKADAATPGANQMSPKDEQNARLQERQRYIEFLDADLQLRQTQINLMRQNGRLGEWLHDAIAPSAGGAPSAPSVQVVPVSHP